MATPSSRASSHWFRRKPLWVIQEQEDNGVIMSESSSSSSHHLGRRHRHLSLWDLVAIGVGGTVGSGIFVLAGYVAHHYAGPSTTLSFAMAGLAAACSGICYAELAGRLPSGGSTYTFCYTAMGEVFAVLGMACLSLEYVVAGAAVARSWGTKTNQWILHNVDDNDNNENEDGNTLNLWACAVCVVSTAILVKGIKESKLATNVFTVLKVALVLFMTVGGFCYFSLDNWTPFVPRGQSGIAEGATACFFAYLGYDGVCVLAGEAQRPRRNVPRAVLWTLAIVTVLYMLAVLALTGMLPYQQLDDTSAFYQAFQHHQAPWLAQITAAGEILTLPVVVLVSLLAQPRLLQAMAVDGLLPEVFGRVDSSGNLRMGVIVSGLVMTLLATFVPFKYLNDLISAGILVAFSMTNSSLVLLRCESPQARPQLLHQTLLLYNTLCLVTGLSLTRNVYPTLTVLSGLLTLSTFLYMWCKCPRLSVFGGSILRMDENNDDNDDEEEEDSYFETPLVPWTPCLGMFVNWYLVAQLSWFGLLLLMGYLGLTTVWYACCCGTNNPRHQDHRITWRHREDDNVHHNNGEDDDEAAKLQQELPRLS